MRQQTSRARLVKNGIQAQANHGPGALRGRREPRRSIGLKILVAGLLAACVSAPTARTTSLAGCQASPVQYSGGSAYVHAGESIRGQLFYYGGSIGTPSRAIMPPGGSIDEKRSTKVLWVVEGAGESLTIEGATTNGGATYHAEFEEARMPGGHYPSIISLPEPGCWRLTVSSGEAKGVVMFRSAEPA